MIKDRHAWSIVADGILWIGAHKARERAIADAVKTMDHEAYDAGEIPQAWARLRRRGFRAVRVVVRVEEGR